jgi:hypothetical protein
MFFWKRRDPLDYAFFCDCKDLKYSHPMIAGDIDIPAPSSFAGGVPRG